MAIYLLDGRRMSDRAAAHDHLQQVLGFPDWYGRNLDALADLLGELGKEDMIILTHRAAVTDGLLLEVFRTLSQDAGFAFVEQE